MSKKNFIIQCDNSIEFYYTQKYYFDKGYLWGGENTPTFEEYYDDLIFVYVRVYSKRITRSRQLIHTDEQDWILMNKNFVKNIIRKEKFKKINNGKT